MNKNDPAWEKLFTEHDILAKVSASGCFEITSEQINKYRESRLMTKFDHVSNLPKLFSDNDLSILPITRGSYVIGQFSAYEKVEYNPDVKNIIIPFPSHLESIDYSNISSESTALNCAYVTGIIKDLAGEDVLPTVSGRMSTNLFDFTIEGKTNPFNISVRNSQCEVDGGYEGNNVLLLFEAKKEQVRDFLIRQLYYPYRLWENKISKQVVPIFLTHSNDTYSFFIYNFEDPQNYNSLRLQEQRNYIITSQTINLQDIRQLLDEVRIIPDVQGVPFPQADNFERVVDLVGLLLDAENDFLEQDFITTNYDFDKRQTAYYSAAGRYIGLIETDRRGKYKITDHGRRIMTMPYYNKYLTIARQILQHEVFNRALRLYFSQASPLSREQAVEIMKTSSIYGVGSEETYYRRAQTVLKWTEWIIDLCE